MARIKRTYETDMYSEATNHSREIGETNDCAVKAVSIVTGLSYFQAHARLMEKGRKKGKGTQREITWKVVQEAGFKVRRMNFAEQQMIIRSYPGIHSTLQGITTHHPRRFPKSWAPYSGTTMLLFSTRHVAAFVNGKVHDWSVNKALRIGEIWIIERKS